MDLTKHNYYRPLMEILEKHPELRTAGMRDIDIRHDSWCRIYKNGYCNCNPDIHVRGPRLPERKSHAS